ncbi:MAG: hypothetical protein ABIA12_02345 [Candidatus Aenigmatarchaeota archaeon]
MARNMDDAMDGFLSKVDGFCNRLFGIGAGTSSQADLDGSVYSLSSSPPASIQALYEGFDPKYEPMLIGPTRHMSKKEAKALRLYLGDFEGVLLDQLRRIEGQQRYYPEVSKHLQRVRETNRMKVELTDGHDGTIEMEYCNRAIYLKRDGVPIADGDMIDVYPIDREYGTLLGSWGVKARVKLYTAEREEDALVVRIPYKIAQRMFGPKYLSTELKPGLRRGLPIAIRNIMPAVTVAPAPIVVVPAQVPATAVLAPAGTPIQAAPSPKTLGDLIFTAAGQDMPMPVASSMSMPPLGDLIFERAKKDKAELRKKMKSNPQPKERKRASTKKLQHFEIPYPEDGIE